MKGFLFIGDDTFVDDDDDGGGDAHASNARVPPLDVVDDDDDGGGGRQQWPRRQASAFAAPACRGRAPSARDSGRADAAAAGWQSTTASSAVPAGGDDTCPAASSAAARAASTGTSVVGPAVAAQPSDTAGQVQVHPVRQPEHTAVVVQEMALAMGWVVGCIV